jgi:hypothetical protein
MGSRKRDILELLRPFALECSLKLVGQYFHGYLSRPNK